MKKENYGLGCNKPIYCVTLILKLYILQILVILWRYNWTISCSRVKFVLVKENGFLRENYLSYTIEEYIYKEKKKRVYYMRDKFHS
jgi:hypothetical protein